MFNFLSPYKYVVGILAVAVLVGGVVYGVHTYNAHQQQIGYDRRDAEQIKLDKAHAETQRLRELALQKEKDDAELQAQAQLLKSAAERDAALAAKRMSDRTIADLNARLATAPLEAVRKYAATCNAVFSACTAEYQAVGAEAQGHADDSLKLQRAWPTK